MDKFVWRDLPNYLSSPYINMMVKWNEYWTDATYGTHDGMPL